MFERRIASHSGLIDSDTARLSWGIQDSIVLDSLEMQHENSRIGHGKQVRGSRCSLLEGAWSKSQGYRIITFMMPVSTQSSNKSVRRTRQSNREDKVVYIDSRTHHGMIWEALVHKSVWIMNKEGSRQRGRWWDMMERKDANLFLLAIYLYINHSIYSSSITVSNNKRELWETMSFRATKAQTAMFPLQDLVFVIFQLIFLLGFAFGAIGLKKIANRRHV